MGREQRGLGWRWGGLLGLGFLLLGTASAAEPEPLWFAGHRVDGYWGVDWAIYEDHSWAKVEFVHDTDLPKRAPGPVQEWSTRRGRAQAAARRSGLVAGVVTDERWAALLRDLEAGEAQIASHGHFGRSYTSHPLLFEFILARSERETRLVVVDPNHPDDVPGPWQRRVGLPPTLATLTSWPGGDGWGTPRRVLPAACDASLSRVSGGRFMPLVAWPDDLALPRPAEGEETRGAELAGEHCAVLRERVAGGLLRLGAQRWYVGVYDRLPREAEMLARLQAPLTSPPAR